MSEAGPKYPGPTEVRETHAGIVFLVGDKAYKGKKPVRFEFLDFSSPEKRLAALRKELELNRRLAPDVYEEVLTIRDDRGEVVDAVLVMRRMPQERSLESLAVKGEDLRPCLQAVACKVAEFHRRTSDSRTSAAIAEAGRRRWLEGRWEENFADLERFSPTLIPTELVETVRGAVFEYLVGREELLESRIELGEVKDCHGDLLSADIFCLDGKPEILDCIEFDDRYRYVDVASEVAFLAMDLVRLGRPAEARYFLEEYVTAYGRPLPYSLLEHYMAYRAAVRSKVACLSYEQGRAEAAEPALFLAKASADHARRAVPLLLVVGGAPGTGKSTLAAALAEADLFAERVGGRPRFELVRSDVVRKALAGLSPAERSGSPPGGGIYTPEFTRKTYLAMFDRAAEALALGRSVVLDATFASEELRQGASGVARRHHATLVELECRAPRQVCEERIQARAREGRDPSEADTEVARLVSAHFDPWPSATPVDTSVPPEESLATAIAAVERAMGCGFSWG